MDAVPDQGQEQCPSTDDLPIVLYMRYPGDESKRSEKSSSDQKATTLKHSEEHRHSEKHQHRSVVLPERAAWQSHLPITVSMIEAADIAINLSHGLVQLRKVAAWHSHQETFSLDLQNSGWKPCNKQSEVYVSHVRDLQLHIPQISDHQEAGAVVLAEIGRAVQLRIKEHAWHVSDKGAAVLDTVADDFGPSSTARHVAEVAAPWMKDLQNIISEKGTVRWKTLINGHTSVQKAMRGLPD